MVLVLTGLWMPNIELPEDLADHIQEQRRLNPRDRSGRGWQSRTYTSQPFAWLESTYQQVQAEHGAIDSWWMNVNTTGEYTGWHAHHSWAKVAVLYVAVPGGAIEFRQGAAYWCETPQAGDLLVFPGSLEHRVRPNPSRNVRISIAFNFKN